MLLLSLHEVRHSLFTFTFSLKARQSQLALSYLTRCASRPRRLYLCLDHDSVRLSLTHISTFRGKLSDLGVSTRSSLSLAMLMLSLAIRGGVDYRLFSLVPRASDHGVHSIRRLPGQAQTW